MSIPKHEFKCNPAAKQLWLTLNQDYDDSIVKPRRSAVAALRRLIANLDRDVTEGELKHSCPLIDAIMSQLCLNHLSLNDQQEILNIWEWMIGLKG